jgi:hypothetical protein
MRIGLLAGLLAGVLVAGFGVAPVSAQDAPEVFPVPDLLGTWVGPYSVIRSNGFADGLLQLKVVEQRGPLLKVEKSWKVAPGGAPGDVGGELFTEAAEPMVGVIGFDGREVQFAEQGDEGTYSGRLIGPDTLELIYIESDQQATAYRVRLQRAP